MGKFEWKDEWIKNHYTEYSGWSEMVKVYNKKFGTDFTRQQFKYRANVGLGLKLNNYGYSEETDKFLEQYYPILKDKELADKYNEIFGTFKTYNQIRQRALKLGVTKTDDYIINRNINAGKARNVPIGTIKRNKEGYDKIKIAERKWIHYSRYVYEQNFGPIPKNYVIIFMDGDIHNYSLSNLKAVPSNYVTLITNKLRLKKQDARITETAIRWCDLYTELEGGRIYGN